MYAIVDVETTGGRPETSKIIEIAIVIHDGKQIVRQFSSLVNPQCRIPYFISQFTGISDDMVANAPQFHEIAREIIEITENTVFVAHNVQFDYGCVRAEYSSLGYNYQRKTLCTVRMSRSAFPGLPSYSLGKLCNSLNIQLKNRHRALGDADATALLFTKIVAQDPELVTVFAEIKKKTLPPLLNEEIYAKIPDKVTGVYYFHNSEGQVIYIGKSKNIKKRVAQHFAARDKKKSIRMLHQIADITYESTGSELVALLLESDEIKKVRPIFNRAQKRIKAIPYYGIYQRLDETGYVELYIDRLKDDTEPITTADNMLAAKNILERAIEKYNLCHSKCNIHNGSGPCFNYQIHKCKGACVAVEPVETYNVRAIAAIDSFSFSNEGFFIIDQGRHKTEKSVVHIDRGIYKGFGFIDINYSSMSQDELNACIKKYSHNRDIQTILRLYVKKGVRKIAIRYEDETPNDITQSYNASLF